MRLVVVAVVSLWLSLVPQSAAAQSVTSCTDALSDLGVDFKKARRRGVDDAVAVKGPLGGVRYRGYKGDDLVLDCSLAYSLAVAGRFLLAHGIDEIRYSSAYQQRKIRGTSRWSRHSFGLAIDLHTFSSDQVELVVKQDYEQGLGDAVDCIGQPLTGAGTILRTLSCQFARSGLFRTVLDPDFDADHYNHFHVEAVPWSERESATASASVRSTRTSLSAM